jgi:hypothetical protein
MSTSACARPARTTATSIRSGCCPLVGPSPRLRRRSFRSCPRRSCPRRLRPRPSCPRSSPHRRTRSSNRRWRTPRCLHRPPCRSLAQRSSRRYSPRPSRPGPRTSPCRRRSRLARSRSRRSRSGPTGLRARSSRSPLSWARSEPGRHPPARPSPCRMRLTGVREPCPHSLRARGSPGHGAVPMPQHLEAGGIARRWPVVRRSTAAPCPRRCRRRRRPGRSRVTGEGQSPRPSPPDRTGGRYRSSPCWSGSSAARARS